MKMFVTKPFWRQFVKLFQLHQNNYNIRIEPLLLVNFHLLHYYYPN